MPGSEQYLSNGIENLIQSNNEMIIALEKVKYNTESMIEKMIEASENSKIIDDNEYSKLNAGYLKVKEFKFFKRGSLNLKFDIKVSTSTAYVKININGIEHMVKTYTYNTYTTINSITIPIQEEDIISIFIQGSSSSSTTTIRNIEILYDEIMPTITLEI